MVIFRENTEDIYAGIEYAAGADDVLVAQFCAEQYNEMVLLRDVEFYSTCEHHMLPFYGKAAYRLPSAPEDRRLVQACPLT